MKRKHIFSVATIGLLSLLLVAGAAVAAVFPEDNTFTGTVNQFEKGIKIGKQGTGGVTFFNGTIVNATTTDGADNPVTFGDNVRIDGRIQRGTNKATDAWNVIVDDGLEVNKDLSVSGVITNDDLQGKLDATVKKDNPTFEAQARVMNIPGVEFVSRDLAIAGATYFGSIFQPSAVGIFEASVQLPQGAVITGFKAYGFDANNIPANKTIVKLRRLENSPLVPTNYKDIAQITSTDGINYQMWTATTVTATIVDNATNTYFVEADVQGDHNLQTLSRAIIEYTIVQP